MGVKHMLTNKEFLIGVVAGVILVRFIAPRLSGVPVIGGVASVVTGKNG